MGLWLCPFFIPASNDPSRYACMHLKNRIAQVLMGNSHKHLFSRKKFSTCAVGAVKAAPTLHLHSQNPRLRANASAFAAAFCSLRGGLLIRAVTWIAINCIQADCRIATAQVENFLNQEILRKPPSYWILIVMLFFLLLPSVAAAVIFTLLPFPAL